MCNPLKLTILAACLAMAVTVTTQAKLPLFGQHSLMDFMVKSRDISQRNPQRSLECFDYYIPLLNDITAEYEASYAACLNAADEARSAADSATQGERDNIESSARTSCLALQACTENNSSIPYFECFVTVGSDNSKSMYGISANASDALVNLREQYRLIDNDQFRCTNNSERVYVENTASTYEELHNCLLGISGVPSTTSPQTTVSSTISDSTWEITTTTEESTTTTEESTTTTEESTTTTEESTTTTEESTTTTAEEPIESTTISDTTFASDEPASRNARHAIKDTKWVHILEKMERHLH